jgi:alginate O-acetyltransferase complex protein AlgI
MLFNSISFLLFFVVVTTIYFVIPQQQKWKWLLLSSCYFYMAFVPLYIFILGFTIVIDYFAGIFIEQAEGRKRKLLLACSIVANIGVLAFFKYWNFVNDLVSGFLHPFGYSSPIPALSILLPIGLSFHTFQAMSYTIEVYRKKQKAERHFGIYALYVMFYPQLVAGPIERPQNLIHQFYEKHPFDYNRVKSGLLLICWGFFKKLVIADSLATQVNLIYSSPRHYYGAPLLLATVFFAFQIYCDFSGYTDIALGTARVMGFNLMSNFNRPYSSRSVSEFWKRWHISLSSWFKSYLYIPLGGNRVLKWKWIRNILLTFIISGLWHGANWTFIVWGGLNGLYLIVETTTQKIRARCDVLFLTYHLEGLLRLLQTGITFSLICLAWIFFRAETLKDADYILTHLFSGFGYSISLLRTTFNLPRYMLFILSSSLLLLYFVEKARETNAISRWLSSSTVLMRWSVYLLFILVILGWGVLESGSQFIYFQF